MADFFLGQVLIALLHTGMVCLCGEAWLTSLSLSEFATTGRLGVGSMLISLKVKGDLELELELELEW